MVMKLYGTFTTNVQRAIIPLFEAEVRTNFRARSHKFSDNFFYVRNLQSGRVDS